MAKGEEVQFLEEQQGRSKVQLRSGLRGWLETKALEKKKEEKEEKETSLELSKPLPTLESAVQPSLPSFSHCVHLFSFGLETVDAELFDVCRRLGGGHRCCPEPCAVAQALRRRGVAPSLVLDARGFPDHDASRRHSGRHVTVLRALLRHRNFEHWLQRARKDILEKLQERS